MQAQASKAKIVALANAGGDTVNAIKQAAEFGIVRGGQKLAPCWSISATSMRSVSQPRTA
jgi:ABC-type branched-subunit amino acid transport system substrate-binding protein